MHRSLPDMLVDPISKLPLQLETSVWEEDKIIAGMLHGSKGRSFPIINGIPRFVIPEDEDQGQTAKSFGYKWQQLETYDSPQVRNTVQHWMVQRYGFESADSMRAFFASRQRVLDAGCG